MSTIERASDMMQSAPMLATAPAGGPASIVIDHVSIEFKAAGVLAVSDVSLTVAPGQFLSIVGPSGCGKTTLLNLAAGLLPAEVSTGTVLVGGKPPIRGNRDIAYMLARDALCPWRTALANAELGTEIRGMPSAQRRQRALDLLAQVSLKGFENAYPKALSQGMRQRVALA
jgi:NitT/TauT family transport system ATP-binding protein